MADSPFRLRSEHQPSGDQPAAIEGLIRFLREGRRDSVLLGVTGSGKTFTMAQVIAQLGRPALVMAPNKTLAAQLYAEFQDLFPENAVEYFVSYYDYYQPEAYVPSSDTYIEKDATINEAIDRMRNSATSSLLSRRDVILVASVSCIYGLGSPEHYAEMSVSLKKGQRLDRDELLHALAAIQYARNNLDFSRGTVRVRGDVVEIFPAYAEDRVVRVELFGDEIDALLEVDPLRGEILAQKDEVTIFPASHYVTPTDRLRAACDAIEVELETRLTQLKEKHKLLEAQRLEQRTRYDVELMRATGFCAGIENYSRFLDGRSPGQPPATLINYFPPDFLLFVDESHVTVPQVGGMYWGDRSRKETLVDYGFRLPSALDNRPLKFEEFDALRKQAVYVSATPGPKELAAAGPAIVEQVIRPTGLVDPEVEVRPAAGQVDDLLSEIKKVVTAGGRVLVTTLTKRMAEELTDYYRDLEVKVKYLHSDIETIERTQLLRDLRLGVFDVLVGINLLREGLDLPEVMLVAVLDADKEGFLRSGSSLIQTCGRAARNVQGRVILYADTNTQSMQRAMGEMERRRTRQLAYNEQHGITPATIKKSIREILSSPEEADYVTVPLQGPALLGPTPGRKAAKAAMAAGTSPFKDRRELLAHIEGLREKMRAAARELRFEEAAKLRDEVFRMEKLDLEMR